MRDTRVYVHALWRLLTDRVLPLDYAGGAAALDGVLSDMAAKLDGRLDLSRLTARVRRLQDLAMAVRSRVLQVRDDAEAQRVNRALVAVSRAIVPMDYTTGDRFDHDPALAQAPYPVLDPVRALAAAEAGSDQARFLAVAAVRACNRLGFALDAGECNASGVP